MLKCILLLVALVASLTAIRAQEDSKLMLEVLKKLEIELAQIKQENLALKQEIQKLKAEGLTPTLDLLWATTIQKQIEALTSTIRKDIRIPTGTIVAFYGEEIPKGWMLCDGSKIPSEFEELRKLVGDHVPDLRGMFLRGANNGRNDKKGDTEIGRKFGTEQGDLFLKHSHSTILPGAAGNNAFADRDPAWCYDDWHGTVKSATTTEQGGTETRPRNIAVNFIIKN